MSDFKPHEEEMFKETLTRMPVDEEILDMLTDTDESPQIIAECAFTWLQVNQ